ncbi:MAG TPA: hypothetical protein VF469_35945 [Kofleriaceae bacterium]
MTARARRPTDEGGTEIFDPERRRVLFGASPGDRVGAAPASPESWDRDATEVTPLPGQPPVEHATPTHIDPSRPSEPLRVISMKERTEGEPPRRDEPRVPLHVQLRSMAEVAGIRDRSSGLGRLAPPHDPHRARRRRRRDNAVWACVGLVLACGISLAIWLIAGR